MSLQTGRDWISLLSPLAFPFILPKFLNGLLDFVHKVWVSPHTAKRMRLEEQLRIAQLEKQIEALKSAPREALPIVAKPTKVGPKRGQRKILSPESAPAIGTSTAYYGVFRQSPPL